MKLTPRGQALLWPTALLGGALAFGLFVTALPPKLYTLEETASQFLDAAAMGDVEKMYSFDQDCGTPTSEEVESLGGLLYGVDLTLHSVQVAGNSGTVTFAYKEALSTSDWELTPAGLWRGVLDGQC